MAKLAYKQEFDEFLASVQAPTELARNHEGRVDEAFSTFNALMLRARTEMIGGFPKLEGAIAGAVAAGDIAFLRVLVSMTEENALGALDRLIDWIGERIAETEATPNENKEQKALSKRYRRALDRELAFFRHHRERIRIMLLDHDPEARGGPKFSDADELIAHLRS